MKFRSDQNIQTDINTGSQPLFSIVIATYNRAQLIKRALNSLISQTEKDWEAIIADDESTDDTFSQVLPYLRNCNNIKYIRKAHSGATLTKNEGIRACRGKYISFLDSDDEYFPNHLESRKAILQRNPSTRFLYGGVKVIGNQYVPDRFFPETRIHLDKCVIGGAFFIEREVIYALRGFRNIQLGSDADLFDRVKKLQIALLETKQPTYIYHHERRHSITNSRYMETHCQARQYLTP